MLGHASTPNALSAATTLLEFMLAPEALKPHWRLWGMPAQDPRYVHTWAAVWYRCGGGWLVNGEQ